MNAEHQRVFDETPPDKGRSRLDEYREIILRWRRQGRTYQRIRELLAERWSVTITTAMLHKFVQSRSRPGKAKVIEVPPPFVPMAYTPTSTPDYGKLDSQGANASARERIRQLKAQPATSKAQKVFEYSDADAMNPIVLIPRKREK